MACGCAGRMRLILKQIGYQLEDGVWRRSPDDPEFPDTRVEEEHLRVLIETMGREIWHGRAQRMLRRLEVSR